MRARVALIGSILVAAGVQVPSLVRAQPDQIRRAQPATPSPPPTAEPAPASGDALAGNALGFMEKGLESFHAGDYPAALAAFNRAAELAPERPNPYRWIGLTHLRRDDCKAGVLAFDKFLSIVPPTDRRTIEVQTLRDRCVRELAPKVGTLIIDSKPVGAEVRLDRAAAAIDGLTPWQNDAVAAGTHLVHLRKDGFRSQSRTVTVGANEIVRLSLDLETDTSRRRRTGLIVGLTVGGVVVVGLAVGLGLGFGLRPAPVDVLDPVSASGAISVRR